MQLFRIIFSLILLIKIQASFAVSDQDKQNKWVDSVFNNLTLDQKLGQLFMVAAYSNRDEKHYTKIDSLVKYYHLGGLIFFQGGPKRQAILTNRYQALARVPLLIGIDGEWGLSMRLDSTINFPRQMTLGATRDPNLAYKMGKEIANHCKRLGIHINFAPVADVNNNPDNPVIGLRSFGETKEEVTEFAKAYMKGMQRNGIIACGKHFPGHGDTDADSHHALPVINHDKKRLNEVELYPFRELMKDSLMSVMVAHLHVPAYDARPNMATTLSYNVVTDLLKNKMGFRGLVFTDALNMKGVSKFYKPGEVDLLALMAGNDVLLFAEDVPVALEKIKQALKDGRLKENELDLSIKKILSTKYWAGLHRYVPVDTTNLFSDLNNTNSKAVQQEMYEKAITIVRNNKNLLPLKELELNNFASVSIGLNKSKEYREALDNYAVFKHFGIAKTGKENEFDKLFDSVSKLSTVIVSLHDLNNRKKENYGISDNSLNFIKRLQTKTNVVLVVFGNLYGLKLLDFAHVIIAGYEDNEVTRKVVPQVIFGALEAKGKLPVTISPDFKRGLGNLTPKLGRLRYCYPENLGFATSDFFKVDSIMQEAVKTGATPGGQLQLVKNGAVIFRKNYGYYTYDKTKPVTNNTVYDLASVTKTAATMQAIMFLADWNKFNPDLKAVDYLPELSGTNKENIILRDLLVHQAGLYPYLDFWRRTVKGGTLDDKYYSKKYSSQFHLPVATGVYTSPALTDSIWRWTINSSLAAEKADTGCYTYKYSDLTFYFLKRIAEKQLNQPMDAFLNQNFYKPLGTSYLGYNPLKRISISSIPPTEEEKFFRNTVIQGTVHDQSAAMCGGVAGHAGLFSNSNDLAILGQMLLQGGYYGGVRYLGDTTIREYTRQQYFNNRRAMGWDRPFPPDEISLASPLAYGHTGFTGTAWWMDPKYEMVFVLLANRTYPFSENKRFTNFSIRTKVLNEVYKVFQKYDSIQPEVAGK